MTTSLKAILIPGYSTTVRLENLQPGNSPGTLIKEARKVIGLKTVPKQLSGYWSALMRLLECGKEAAEVASEALLRLVELTQGSMSPSLSADLRKTMRAKSASLSLKLAALSALTSFYSRLDPEQETLIRIWCLDYASEAPFLAFLVKLIQVSPDVLSRFDFSEVVILICNHCLVSPKDVSMLFSTSTAL